MREYWIDLSKYGITKEECIELRGFCMQYERKKQRIADILDSVPGCVATMPPANILPGDPTGEKAARLDMLIRDCEMIEQSALEAVGAHDERVLYQHLLENVTSRKRKPIGSIPCGKNQFYEYRRRFFAILFEKKGNWGSQNML